MANKKICIPGTNKLVSVVIVTAGIGNYLEPCLSSINRQTYPEIEIIVIDNSYDNGQATQKIRGLDGIKLYRGNNLAYCQSLNKGIEMSAGDFILCLNDDVVLERRFIEEALGAFSVSPGIGMAAGKVLRFDKKTIDSTGLFLSPWRSPSERGYGCRNCAKFEKKEYVFGVNGAVAFYSRKMLDDIKLNGEWFDNDFNFFYEDLDIAWRAQNFGWQAYYIPRAIAYHLRGNSVRQGKGIGANLFARCYLNDELNFDLFKNRYLTIIKNETFLNFLIYLPFIVIYDIFIWGFIIFLRPGLIKKIFSGRFPLMNAFKKRRSLKRGY